MRYCYHIWLQKVFRNDPQKAIEIVNRYKTPAVFYRKRKRAAPKLSFLNENDVKRILAVPLTEAVEAEKLCRKKGIEILTWENEHFPEKLKEIPSPPFLIYAFGNLDILNSYPVVSVVGTRKAGREPMRAAEHFAYDLASVGIVICSGVAEGIDSAAINGALRLSAKTIGIMACSLDVNYPAATRREKVALLKNGGVLISEYPPTERAYPKNFNPRNRLMSGISDAVLAVEAPERSGTLITVSHAVEQGKDVYVIPWGPYDRDAAGSNALISEGATAVFSASEIFLPLKIKYPEKIILENYDKNSKDIIFGKRNPALNERKNPPKNHPIIKALQSGSKSFDELVIDCEMEPSLIATELIKLELEGYTEKDEDGNIILK